MGGTVRNQGTVLPRRVAAVVLRGLLSAACGAEGSDVAPPRAPAGAVTAPTSAAPAPAAGPEPARPATAPAAGALPDGSDPAVAALRAYLHEQARAVNARDEAAPAFRATLTPEALEWALPLLRENFGDLMPGPYPMGVLESARPTADSAVVRFCLRSRGWQVDRATGRPVNAPRHSTGHAEVRRVGGTWLVADVVDDGGTCDASTVVEERF